MIDEITRVLNGKSDNVELKAEKIELGVVQDIEKLSSKLKSEIKSILSLQNEANKERSNAFSVIRKAVEDAKKAQDRITGKFETFKISTLEAEILFGLAKKSSKDLGIDYSEVKGVKELQKTVDTYDNFTKEAELDINGITYNLPKL